MGKMTMVNPVISLEALIAVFEVQFFSGLHF